TRGLIHAYLDRELDLVRALEIEQHLDVCPACAQGYQNQQSLRSLVRERAPYFKSPAGLESRIRSRLSAAATQSGAVTGEPIESAQATKRFRPFGRETVSPTRWWAWAGMAAALAIATIVVSVIVTRRSRPRGNDLLAEEVVSSHIRSLMANHLTDVGSSDQHTVKPWFAGKLDFSPPVVDLAPAGFPLIGGRLDYLGGRPVAALVYGRRKHLINVFIWPPGFPGGDSGPPAEAPAHQGYNVWHWTKAGMTYWAVSDVSTKDLGELAQLLQAR
ncbi:MAG TPA: anti-sigma factor, partial [Terriglobia bacterium]|nr:anti-sigma factor [Terriglobia bacterium]